MTHDTSKDKVATSGDRKRGMVAEEESQQRRQSSERGKVENRQSCRDNKAVEVAKEATQWIM